MHQKRNYLGNIGVKCINDLKRNGAGVFKTSDKQDKILMENSYT